MNLPNMPDLTPAALVAIVKDVVAVAVAFGAPLSMNQQIALLALAASTTALLLHHDQKLRVSRARNLVGPILDSQAADAIRDAVESTAPPPAPRDPLRAITETAKSEAELEAAAHDANEGIDPATLE